MQQALQSGVLSTLRHSSITAKTLPFPQPANRVKTAIKMPLKNTCLTVLMTPKIIESSVCCSKMRVAVCYAEFAAVADLSPHRFTLIKPCELGAPLTIRLSPGSTNMPCRRDCIFVLHGASAKMPRQLKSPANTSCFCHHHAETEFFSRQDLEGRGWRWLSKHR